MSYNHKSLKDFIPFVVAQFFLSVNYWAMYWTKRVLGVILRLIWSVNDLFSVLSTLRGVFLRCKKILEFGSNFLWKVVEFFVPHFLVWKTMIIHDPSMLARCGNRFDLFIIHVVLMPFLFCSWPGTELGLPFCCSTFEFENCSVFGCDTASVSHVS